MTGHLERFPIGWNHLIEMESLSFKELEHVLIEKVGQTPPRQFGAAFEISLIRVLRQELDSHRQALLTKSDLV
jgi:hypothetical protein